MLLLFFCASFLVKSLHDLGHVYKMMKNRKHFQNTVLGKNRGGSGIAWIRPKTVQMLKKVACMAVYQLAAFAFVRDVPYLVRRCTHSPKWSSLVNHLQDDVFNYVIHAYPDNSAAANGIPSNLRRKVQDSVGYVVLCKFLVITLRAATHVVSSPNRQQVNAARKLRNPSSDTCSTGEQPSVLDVQFLRKAVEELTEAETAFQDLLDRTLSVLTTVKQHVAEHAVDHFPVQIDPAENTVTSFKRKGKHGRVLAVKRSSVSPQRPEPSAKKKTK